VLLSLIDPFSLQFAPTYHEYVLYSNEGDYEPTKYSPGSIVLSGQDIQLVEISVLDAKVPVSSSLLSSDADLAETMPCQVVEEAVTSAEQYNLLNLLNVDLSDHPSEVPAIPDRRKQ
jgi:hypothetical protein